jgi:transposase-like protein
MTSLTVEDQILKADGRGRVRVPRERREALLAEFARSGVSAAEFARLTGIKYSTFAGWVARQRRSAAAESPVAAEVMVTKAASSPVRLFEAVVEAPCAAVRPLAVELPGGARLFLTEPAQVPLAAELLATLAQRGGRPC